MGTVLHMDTDRVRDLTRMLSSMSEEMKDRHNDLLVQCQNCEWQGSGREQFVSEMDAQYRQASALIDQIDALRQRVEAEVAEWENAAASLNQLGSIIGKLERSEMVIPAGLTVAGLAEILSIDAAKSFGNDFHEPGSKIDARVKLIENNLDQAQLGNETITAGDMQAGVDVGFSTKNGGYHDFTGLHAGGYGEVTALDAKVEGDTTLGGVRLGGEAEADILSAQAGIGVGMDSQGGYAGAYESATLLSASMSGVIGSKDLGLAGQVQAEALSEEGFIGYRHGQVGAEIGATLVSVKGTAGVNVAGANVGITGEIGVEFNIGFKFGKETEIALGPFKIGFSFGGALGS
jgi:uncharacterized protein YukE